MPAARGEAEGVRVPWLLVSVVPCALAACDVRSGATSARSNTAAATRSSVDSGLMIAADAASPAPSASATASAAAAREYDLASDLAERLDAARAELGTGAAHRVEGNVFLIVASHGGWPFDPSVALAHRTRASRQPYGARGHDAPRS